MFWLVTMIASWLLALWVTWRTFFEKEGSPGYIIGLALICYFTTACYTSTYDYE
jgi:hypothetical protein